MKAKKIHFNTVIGLIVILLCTDITAQDGMDRDNSFGFTNYYSKLRRDPPFGPVFQNDRNEKALGIYTELILPQSAVDVNTDFTHMPAFLTTWYNRGEVFRTNCPALTVPNPISIWRMEVDGTEKGALSNDLTRPNDFNFQASEGSAWFVTPSGPNPDRRMRIHDGPADLIGMGNYDAAFWDAASLLHLQLDISRVNIQFTNGLTNPYLTPLLTDGFHVGINGNVLYPVFAEINMKENAPMQLYTNDVERIHINAAANNQSPMTIGYVGINNGDPRNQLEITSDANAPQPAGLRFTNLTENSASAGSNNTNTVLSVNGAGDVILVDDQGGAPTGADDDWYDVTTAAPPTSINANIYTFGDVAIGQQAQGIRLDVLSSFNTGASRALRIRNSTPADLISIFDDGHAFVNSYLPSAGNGWTFTVDQANGGNGTRFFVTTSNVATPAASAITAFALDDISGTNTGVASQADNDIGDNVGFGTNINTTNSTASNFGIRTAVTGASINHGGQFEIFSNGNPTNFGVRSFVSSPNSVNNYGIRARATGLAAANNYGIWAMGDGGTNNFAGFFNGNVKVNGNLECITNVGCPSDANLKNNVQPLSNALAVIDQLQPKTFTFDTVGYPQFAFQSGQMMGLIGQDVEPILPGLITNSVMPAQYDTAGNQISSEVDYKSLAYAGFVPLLIQGMKEQQQLIEDMQAEMDQCCNQAMNKKGESGNNGRDDGQAHEPIDVTLEPPASSELGDAKPNPFPQQVEIPFFIAEDAASAVIEFRDIFGRTLKAIEIQDKGYGSLAVQAASMPNGTYLYSLVVNGELMDTKKMLKTN